MKKIFAITCHKLNNPLFFTVRYLSSFPDNTVIIHLDKKCNIDDFYELSARNVIFTQQRENIVWGGVSQIKATINLLQESLRLNFEYFFLLSGDDIPVMSNKDMDNFISRHDGLEFIHFQDYRNNYVDPVRRVKFRFLNAHYSRRNDFISRALRRVHLLFGFLFINKSFSVNEMKFPPLYKGINWFGITKSSVFYILNYIENNPWYLNAFENSLCCDEVFFHSILNTNENAVFYFDSNALNNALRYIDWVSGPQFPKVLTENDLDKIKQGKVFFARKIPDDMPISLMKKIVEADLKEKELLTK